MRNCFLLCCIYLFVAVFATAQVISEIEIDAETDREILNYAVAPLTKSTLEDYVGKWQKAVQDVSEEIAALEIEALKSGTKTEEVRTNLVNLREERSALIERTRIVADSLDMKGGDTQSLRKYLGAIGGLKAASNDVETKLQTFQGLANITRRRD